MHKKGVVREQVRHSDHNYFCNTLFSVPLLVTHSDGCGMPALLLLMAEFIRPVHIHNMYVRVVGDGNLFINLCKIMPESNSCRSKHMHTDNTTFSNHKIIVPTTVHILTSPTASSRTTTSVTAVRKRVPLRHMLGLCMRIRSDTALQTHYDQGWQRSDTVSMFSNFETKSLMLWNSKHI